MTPVRMLAVAACALAIGGATTAGGYAVAGADDAPSGVLGPGTVTYRMGIEHSAFSTDRIVVQPGTTIRFVVENSDPINHELIVGDNEVHRRHAAGSEKFHPPVPGEVSVTPGETAYTFFTIDGDESIIFACHLPGHVAYGMEGVIEIAAE